MNFPAPALASDEDPRDTGVHPAHPLFWARRSAGHGPLLAAAWLHALAGAVAAASCAALWSRAGGGQPYLLDLALAGGAVAIAGLLAVLLSLPRAAAPALLARVLLPAADLAAAVAACWLLSDRSIVLPLFMVPAATACALLSWRGGVVFAVLSQAGYCTLAALLMGPTLDAWIPQTLVLAGLLLLQTGSLSFSVARMAEVTAALQMRLSALRRDRAARAAEQARLLDGLTLVEETQARLEQERVQVNRQIVALVGAAQRLADGDPGGVRALAPGMYGPLDLLTAALSRLAARDSGAGANVGAGVVVRPELPAAPVALPAPATPALPAALAGGLGDALREQGRLLTAADTLLRDLGIRANELMAAAQEARQQAATPHDGRADALDAALRDIERLARDQSADAATLGSRLAQLLVRQSDLDATLRRAPHAPGALAAGGVTPLWPAASGGTGSASAGISSSRHAVAWEPSPPVSRAASGPLR